LKGRLEDPLPQLRHQVPHLHLRTVDHVSVRSRVDRSHDLTHRLLNLFPHPRGKLLLVHY
jgi:hypothetical protein